MRTFFIITTSFLCLNCQQSDNTTLKLVHVFFRHGSRTPDKHEVYPQDPYAVNDFRPTGYGQLTNNGKKRAYRLGTVLRNRYRNFLSETYTPDVVLTTTTDVDRTKMSALLALAALFPPSPSEQWDDTLPWIPIPYHYEKMDKDYVSLIIYSRAFLHYLHLQRNLYEENQVNQLRRPNSYCPAYMRQLEGVLSSDAVQRTLKEHTKTFQHISQHTGRTVSTLQDMFNVYQVLTSEENMNLTLPKWTKSIYPDEVHYLAAKQCHFENYNRLMKRLNGGRMLKKVVENMIKKSEGVLVPHGRKMYLYSGHDNNVINILAALNLYEPHFPKYSSAVIIELHKPVQGSQNVVKVFYLKDVYDEPEEQFIRGCGSSCELGTFIQIMEPHLPGNFTKECESDILLD